MFNTFEANIPMCLCEYVCINKECGDGPMMRKTKIKKTKPSVD